MKIISGISMKLMSLTFIALIITTLNIHAQVGDNTANKNDSIECIKNLSVYKEFVKLGSIENAIPAWQYVINNCPDKAKYIYTDGEEIMEYRIKKAEDHNTRELLIDTLLALYDKRITYFGQENFVLGKKCIAAYKYKKNDSEYLLQTKETLQNVITNSGNKTSSANIAYFLLISEQLFDVQQISAIEFVQDYLFCKSALDKVKAAPDNNKNFEQTYKNLNKIFLQSNCTTCSCLESAIQELLKIKQADYKLILELLRLNECQSGELYESIAEQDFNTNPGHEAASNLAQLLSKNEHYTKAITYYKKAAELLKDDIKSESDSMLMGDYLARIASLQLISKQLQDARKSAFQALEYRPDWGTPYMLIGNIYMSAVNTCNLSDFEKQTVYWAAADKFARAAKIDSTFSNDAKTKIKQCEQQFPTKEEAFMHSLTNGKSYTIPCWIEETTTARFVR